MDSLITVMNKLQDVISTVRSSHKVDIPQIVVVGSQSSGKSSVLESLVGKSFLPRGTGIVTRAPLILHLINPPKHGSGDHGDSEDHKDYATFLHKPDVVYHNFHKVRKEIETQTAQLAGENKNISDQPIVLNVYTRQMYNLSFVDLPGLTKVPVGEQPLDIEEKIRNLVLSFIKNPNSIILAVVTANTDPATSESLHIAKSVDPNGDRTIAVVTKIDIMDAGTDANELLSGEVIPVKLGIIGVVNRSQKDINEQKSIADSMENESTFFRKMYPFIAEQHGTVVLGKRLQALLIQKIKNTCPELKKQLYDMNAMYGAKVKQFQEFTSNYDQALLDLITHTATSYNNSLFGLAKNMDPKSLNGGAKIANYFKFHYKKAIDEIDPLYGLSTDGIINILKNASGISMGVFMPESAFNHLVKIQLKQMEGPSINCVNVVHEELIQNIYNLDEDISQELKKYPKLIEKIYEVLQGFLDKVKQNTIESVSKLIRYQEAFINTDHPDFIEAVISSKEYKELLKQKTIKISVSGSIEESNEESDEKLDEESDGESDEESDEEPIGTKLFYKSTSLQKLSKAQQLSKAQKHFSVDNRQNQNMVAIKAGSLMCDKEYMMRKTVEKLTTCVFSSFADSDKLILQSRAGLLVLFIQCYFKVIKKNIQDTVPKTIMYEMVNKVRANFHKDLVSKIYKSKDSEMAKLLLESPNVMDERRKSQNYFDASVKALKLMREIDQLCHVTE